MPSDQEILKQFKNIAKDIWKTPTIDNIKMDFECRKGGCLMSVRHNARAKAYAIGNTLVRTPSEMTLIISDEARNLPKKQFTQLLKHEALHLGYQRHDADFRRIANKLGIPITFSLLNDGGYNVQIKDGTRYKTVETFQTLNEARSYAERIAHKDVSLYRKAIKGKTSKEARDISETYKKKRRKIRVSY